MGEQSSINTVSCQRSPAEVKCVCLCSSLCLCERVCSQRHLQRASGGAALHAAALKGAWVCDSVGGTRSPLRAEEPDECRMSLLAVTPLPSARTPHPHCRLLPTAGLF